MPLTLPKELWSVLRVLGPETPSDLDGLHSEAEREGFRDESEATHNLVVPL